MKAKNHLMRHYHPTFNPCVFLGRTNKTSRTDFVSSKILAGLDICQLSIIDYVYIIQAAVEALSLCCDTCHIRKSSFRRGRKQMRKERAESIKTHIQNNVAR